MAERPHDPRSLGFDQAASSRLAVSKLCQNPIHLECRELLFEREQLPQVVDIRHFRIELMERLEPEHIFVISRSPVRSRRVAPDLIHSKRLRSRPARTAGFDFVTRAKTPNKTPRCAKTPGPMYSVEMPRLESDSASRPTNESTGRV